MPLIAISCHTLYYFRRGLIPNKKEVIIDVELYKLLEISLITTFI